MRTEEKIRAGIKKQEALLELESSDRYKQIIGHGIKAMRWCLGEVIPQTYYCSECEIEHDEVECPGCHSTRVLRPPIPEEEG